MSIKSNALNSCIVSIYTMDSLMEESYGTFPFFYEVKSNITANNIYSKNSVHES